MDFFDTLVRYEVSLWRTVDRELTRRGEVSLATLHVLRVLDRGAGHARVQDLSDQIGITVGAASKFVDRLERDGLAVRSPNPANRRSSLLSLTEAGERAVRSGAQVSSATVTHAVQGEDVEVLTAALARLQARLLPDEDVDLSAVGALDAVHGQAPGEQVPA